MKRGKELHHSLPQGLVDFYCAMMGGGAATAGALPADGVLDSGAVSKFPARVNHAATLAYVSTGIYTLTYIEDMHVKHLVDAKFIVVDDGASPTTALVATATALLPGTRSVTVKVYTPAGTLTDLGTSDLLIGRLTGWDSTG
jgi:hypothetical protein